MSDNELTAEKNYGELFNDGQLIEGYRAIRYEWYHDNTRVNNGRLINYETEKLYIGDTKGTFQVFLSPPNCEKITSNIIKVN